MKVIKKNSYSLKKVENNTSYLFNLIKKNIPTSIFSSLNHKFFHDMIKKKIINLYVIHQKTKICTIITVVTVKNFVKLKYRILYFFLMNPFNFFLNILKILKSISKGSIKNFDNSYLYLLHLIIFKKNFMSISVKKKDQTINFFFKHILKSFNTKSLFLCYEKNNLKADKFYLRNNFKVYNTNKNLIFIKKKIR